MGKPFPRDMRLLRGGDFAAVQRARAVKHAGPLRVGARPNGLPRTRLGLAISRKVGPAPTRNAIKRRLREALRLMQHELPGGYDVVVSVRPHEVTTMGHYQAWLREAIQQLDRHWRKRPS